MSKLFKTEITHFSDPLKVMLGLLLSQSNSLDQLLQCRSWSKITYSYWSSTSWDGVVAQRIILTAQVSLTFGD